MPSSGHDVFVIGGGPVGLATAIAARQKGFDVVVADGCEPPVDKACGEALLPDCLRAAACLGLRLPFEESFAFRGIRFVGEGTSVTGEFPNGMGRGMRRTVLHRALAEQAERCGVELRWGCAIADFDRIRARWIVGADGTSSRVRAWAGLDSFRRDSRRYGFRLHFRMAPWTDFAEIHWGDGCQVSITPIAPDAVGASVLSSDPKMRVHEALKQFPDLSARFEGMIQNTVERGALTTSRRLRLVTRGNVALVGDASGSVDAITAEGLALGFQQAIALADALERGDLSQYETAHRHLALRPRFMADFTLLIDHRRRLRKRAFPAMASRPELFGRLLAIHVGAAHLLDFAPIFLSLGWRILTI